MSDLSKVLEDMHTALTKALLGKIEDGTATAADLSVARALLKDNHITALPKAGTPLGSLTDSMTHYGDDENVLPFAVTK